MTARPAIATTYLDPFETLTRHDVASVGGKNAALGELLRSLASRGVRVPEGFALTAEAFRLHLREAGLTEWVFGQLDALDLRDLSTLATVAAGIRNRVRDAPLPPVVAAELAEAYADLSARYGDPAVDVPVRSSATAEDLPTASFAGQHDSFLNVRGGHDLDLAVRRCMASLFTDRAIVYRFEHGFAHRSVALSVGVQKMVRADLGSASVIFTLDTESAFLRS